MEKIIMVFSLVCSCSFAGEISEIYFKNQSTNSIEDRMKNRAITSDVVSTNYGITEIGIERSGCLGSCPAYALIVKSDGSFHYKGENYVERKGDFTGTISVWEFNNLAQFIKESGFVDLKDTYMRGITDSSTIYTMIVMNGKHKVISDYSRSGPTKLWAIEQLIDHLLVDAKWNDSQEPTDGKK